MSLSIAVTAKFVGGYVGKHVYITRKGGMTYGLEETRRKRKRRKRTRRRRDEQHD